jgi:hypothetical protein
MFPAPTPLPVRPCARCRHPTRVDRLVAGRYGSDCAEKLGLLGRTTDTGQDGTDLLDLLDAEPDDCCDGWDRPSDMRRGIDDIA